MPLIKGISGIRGTIGGKIGATLTPVDVALFVSAFAWQIRQKKAQGTVVCGRDARISGSFLYPIVLHTLRGMGVSVIDLNLTTTPTVALAVAQERAGGGVMLSASHNPKEWNALKFFNADGLFIAPEQGRALLQLAETQAIHFSTIQNIGAYRNRSEYYLKQHTEAVAAHPLVFPERIAEANFSVVVDGINSSGARYVPALLHRLGVKNIKVLNDTPDGNFNHNPEPLEAHLQQIAAELQTGQYDIGIVVDPDVDRLCFLDEKGAMFGEEYSLVAIADYVLAHKKGTVVNNILSSHALHAIAVKHGVSCYSSQVGEVYVVEMMKEKKAVIGGEGSGGIIVPDFHYGRDALIGIGLFLSRLAQKNIRVSELKKTLPAYVMIKEKAALHWSETLKTQLLQVLSRKYPSAITDETEGLKYILEEQKAWVCIRGSNTEPVVRIYAEATTKETAQALINSITDTLCTPNPLHTEN